MQEFVPGQRWISDAELNHGLGTVLKSDHRSVTIVFIASGETRTYAKETAPLTRAHFSVGDTIRSHEGWNLKVKSVEEANGLLTYSGEREDQQPATLPESELDNFIQINKPVDRLLSSQIDSQKWFELRYQTIRHLNKHYHSEIRGLSGGRTSLIPHQLYIAHEVANRYAPRVLLADEVGLGKTIEAGLILHHQLLTELARRVLIVVPETLTHQWLVEMIRRFNLNFSVFNEERCLAEEESATQENPFHTEQLVLCSLNFLTENSHRFEQALDGDWDLLVVDEAHHLQWSVENASTDYKVIEQLSARTRGVLLLTATPEQLGKESHFARLRLLDASRFSDYEEFLKEETHYEPIAQAVDDLLNQEALSDSAGKTLLEMLQQDNNIQLREKLVNYIADPAANISTKDELIDYLLDRHGTGRILYRNTRGAIKGFPQRKVTHYPLPLPEPYENCLGQFKNTGVIHPQMLLSPELLFQDQEPESTQRWFEFDSRIDWLANKLKSLRPDKVLVIVSSALSALDIAEALRIKRGIHAAVFHEGLSIVERDRAAAYFADTEYGTQILICSEIGSEGRNFQFAHHLVLFDLPYNPDLLEQRIGRLDRIGQTDTIEIHVPYLDNSPQMVMYHWYHEGLSAFEHTCPAGHSVFSQVESTLLETLHQHDEGIEDLPALIDTTRALHEKFNQDLQKGRDRLLEYNSCRPKIANQLAEKIHIEDIDPTLQDYLEIVFDNFGIDSEIHSKTSYVLHPGPQTDLSAFPGITDEGATITFDRDTALTNEDMHFLTWEHNMVRTAMEMILSNEQGNTAVCAIKNRNLEAGTLSLESIYILESVAEEAMHVNRYLPPTTIRVVIDSKGNELMDVLPHDFINANYIAVKKEIASRIVKSHKQELKQLADNSESVAIKMAPSILEHARHNAHTLLQQEINRLESLQQINPNIRNEEIEFFKSLLASVNVVLDSTQPRLDALRVIVAT
ncbi:RNA polymerase-associated protein RapA [Kaarinaea lacus]